jgi:coenzyme Q-binding protein COQ10
MSATEIEVRRRLPYAAEQLRALVADVRAYPHFIPWVKSIAVRDEIEEGAARSWVAEATVGWRAFVERFATRVTENRTSQEVTVNLVTGPFRALANRWRFQPLPGGGCELSFWIRYEFKNPVLQVVAAANKQLAADRIMAAFLKEAERRYGGQTSPAPIPAPSG